MKRSSEPISAHGHRGDGQGWGGALETFTIKEIASRLKVCPRTAEKLVAKGHIESSVLPGTERTRRITPNQLKRYIAKMEGESL